MRDEIGRVGDDLTLKRFVVRPRPRVYVAKNQCKEKNNETLTYAILECYIFGI